MTIFNQTDVCMSANMCVCVLVVYVCVHPRSEEDQSERSVIDYLSKAFFGVILINSISV